MFCEIVLSSSHECGREIIVWAPAAVSRLSNLHYKTSSNLLLFGCPEGSWGYLGAKMVPKMVPRGPKRPPDDAKTDFDQILVDFS